MGDEYVRALSKGLRHSDHISEIELSANRLTFYGVNPLLNSITGNRDLLKRLRNLDLSFNKIGNESIKNLIKYINNEECELEELNLEGNSLGDNNIIKLSNAINCSLYNKISLINFGRNQITDESCVALANLIGNCFGMQTFMLHWNQIRNQGASMIINKCKRHSGLRILDLSWNTIGNSLSKEPDDPRMSKTDRSNFNFYTNDFRKTMQINFKKGKEVIANPTANITQLMTVLGTGTTQVVNKNISQFSKELGEYFKDVNVGLVHLDISHNNIGYDDAVHISQEVKANHSILGLHLDGNEMYTDELGFVHPIKKQGKENDYFANSQIYYGIGKETNIIRTNISKVRKIRAKNNCWICEGWREIPFHYTPNSDVNVSLLTVKIHLNFENWKPFDTNFSKGKFSCTRMCPPGEILYFFTIDKLAVDNYGQNTIDLKEPITYEFDGDFNKELSNIHMMNLYNMNQSFQQEETDLEQLNKTYDSLTNVDKISVKRVGKIAVEINPFVIDDFCRNMLKYCEPRPIKRLNKFVKPRTPWSYDISLWASHDYRYDGDSEAYLDEVFEHDFNRCRMQKDAKTEDVYQEVKALLRKHYRKM